MSYSRSKYATAAAPEVLARLRARSLYASVVAILGLIVAYDFYFSQVLFAPYYSLSTTTSSTVNTGRRSINDGYAVYASTGAEHRPSMHNSSAYVFLALGVQANQLNCPAAIESLVRIGKWDGHVYMLTGLEQN
jgi:hypothetical protein